MNIPYIEFIPSPDEYTDKEYRNDVIVTINNRTYSLYFIDIDTLKEQLNDEIELGFNYLANPGLVVVPSLSLDTIYETVNRLNQEGYFNSLLPIN